MIVQAQSGNPGQHRHQQQHGQRRGQHAPARCHRADQDHRQRRPLVRYSAFTPVARFGNLGRNVIIGPGFNNTDFSVIKNTELSEEMRAAVPGRVLRPLQPRELRPAGQRRRQRDFWRITNTRFPTGESGSSRQMQFALKLMLLAARDWTVLQVRNAKSASWRLGKCCCLRWQRRCLAIFLSPVSLWRKRLPKKVLIFSSDDQYVPAITLSESVHPLDPQERLAGSASSSSTRLKIILEFLMISMKRNWSGCSDVSTTENILI